MMYCNEVEQLNAGCNEIKSNIVAKLQNVSRGEKIKEKKVKQKRKNEKIDTTYKRNSHWRQEETLM